MEPKTLQENYVLYRDPSVCSVTLGMLEGGENKYKKQKTKKKTKGEEERNEVCIQEWVSM